MLLAHAVLWLVWGGMPFLPMLAQIVVMMAGLLALSLTPSSLRHPLAMLDAFPPLQSMIGGFEGMEREDWRDVLFLSREIVPDLQRFHIEMILPGACTF